MNNLRQSILRVLYFNYPQSIAEISDKVGKSIPLVTRAVNTLLRDGQLVNCGLRASTGGRRAATFEINKANENCIVALAVDQYAFRIAALDLNNDYLLPSRTTEADLMEDPQIYDRIIRSLEETLDSLGTRDVLGIGITIPGFVDAATGINSSFPPNSPMYNLKENIETHFGVQTFLENDSSAIAIAEHEFGLARNIADSLVINLNWGVGLGIIVQHQLFKGHSGFAGEFSHIPLADENKLCSCGKKGCLEVEASLLCAMNYIYESLDAGDASILRPIYEKRGKLSMVDIVEAANRGDQVTIIALKKIAHMLGKGIATLIHILNPQSIIVSGQGARFSEVLLPQIQSSVQEYCIPRLAKDTLIQISQIKNIQLLASASIAVLQMDWNHQKQTV